MDSSASLLKRKNPRGSYIVIILGIFTFGLLIALIAVSTQKFSGGVDTSHENEKLPVCGSVNPNDNFIDLREPETPGPFHDLTVSELLKVRKFLDEHPMFRTSKAVYATVQSSYIFDIELFPPSKAQVLNFLDGTGPQPTRQARVIMFRGDLLPPVVEEYICDVRSEVERCELMNLTSRRNPVEFSVRSYTGSELSAISNTILRDLDTKIGFILKESFGATFTQCSESRGCLVYTALPVGTGLLGDINERRMWIRAEYNFIFSTVHPVDFGVLCRLDGSDVKDWRAEKLWYAGRLYNSTEELTAGYISNSVPKVKVTMPTDPESLYATFHRRGTPSPAKPQRPPTLVEPDGKRYSLKDRQVSYLHWTFNFRMQTVSGPVIHDVRYKGERIAYEICLAEISVFYSGTAMEQVTDIVDSGFLLGIQSRTLVRGADCPETATLVNQTFYNQGTGQPVAYDATFCLFENNNGYPLRRHSSYGASKSSFFGGMMDTVLILRSALTVGNYDYIVDYRFHQNGVIETQLMSTGYILSSAYSETERPYAFRVQDNVAGTIHQHLAHFKVDLDISGTPNRYQTLDIVPEEVKLATFTWVDFHQTKFTPTLKRTEEDALFKFNFDTPKYHLVFNNSSRNKFGEYRAYRIEPSGMSKLLIPEGQGNEPSISWARHQMVVTKHKDDEFLSSSNYAVFDSANPVVNFSSFYADNENIVDEDLVFWITCSLQHIPHSEDIPVTPTTGNHLGFFLLPYNYFPECPSMGSRDAIYVEHIDPTNTAKGVKVERYGNTREQCILPKASLEEDVIENPNQVLVTR